MGSPQHIAGPLGLILQQMPEELRKEYLIERHIKRIQDQFAKCVDPYILDHVNSIYLVKEDSKETVKDVDKKNNNKFESANYVSRETSYCLTVYVDNSIIAAELNAQRELIVLKFRELFHEKIFSFSIKISRGHYLKNYPYREEKTETLRSFHPLTPEEEEEIEQRTSVISDSKIRASFQRALKAIKEHPLKN